MLVVRTANGLESRPITDLTARARIRDAAIDYLAEQGVRRRIPDHRGAVMSEGVASGLVRPPRDGEARLRYLTYQTMGARPAARLPLRWKEAL